MKLVKIDEREIIIKVSNVPLPVGGRSGRSEKVVHMAMDIHNSPNLSPSIALKKISSNAPPLIKHPRGPSTTNRLVGHSKNTPADTSTSGSKKYIRPVFPPKRNASLRNRKLGLSAFINNAKDNREDIIMDLEQVVKCPNDESLWESFTEKLFEMANKAGADTKTSHKGLNGGAIA